MSLKSESASQIREGVGGHGEGGAGPAAGLRRQHAQGGLVNLDVSKESWPGEVSTKETRSSDHSYRNVQWFRGGLVFEAHRLVYHSA